MLSVISPRGCQKSFFKIDNWPQSEMTVSKVNGRGWLELFFLLLFASFFFCLFGPPSSAVGKLVLLFRKLLFVTQRPEKKYYELCGRSGRRQRGLHHRQQGRTRPAMKRLKSQADKMSKVPPWKVSKITAGRPARLKAQYIQARGVRGWHWFFFQCRAWGDPSTNQALSCCKYLPTQALKREAAKIVAV